MNKLINKSKVVLAIILILSLMPISTASATLGQNQTLSANLTLTTENNTVSYGDELAVLVEASNIQPGEGLSKIEAELEIGELFEDFPDKNLEARNGWSVNYVQNTKRIVATPQPGTASITVNGPVFQIPIQVKTKESFTSNNSGQGSLDNLTGGTQSPFITPTPAPNNLITGNNETQTPAPNNGNTNTEIPTRGYIKLKDITMTGGIAKTKKIPDISVEFTVSNGIGITETPATTEPPTLTEPATDTPVATVTETPSEIIHAGLNDAPVMLLLALGVVAVVSFVGYKKFSNN